MSIKEIWQNIRPNLWALAIIIPATLGIIGTIFSAGIMYEQLSERVEQNTEHIERHQENASEQFSNVKEKISVNQQLLNEFREFRAEQQQNLKNMSDNIDRIRQRLNQRENQ